MSAARGSNPAACREASDATETIRDGADLITVWRRMFVKSHGATDPEGFAAAVDLGYDMVRYELQGRISQMLGQHPVAPTKAPAAESISS